MNNATFVTMLRTAADALARAPELNISAGTSGTAPLDAPEGFVRVTPTGPNATAHGVSRLYPTMTGLGKPLNAGAWSWGVQMAFNNMRRPDGSLYLTQGATYAVNASPFTANGESVAKAGGDPSPFYAEAADRIMHTDDWMTQAELDKAAADAAAHLGAAWLAQPDGTQQTGEDKFDE